MNKKIGIPFIIFLLILIGLGIYIFYRNSITPNSETNYEANKTSTSNEVNNNNERG